MIKIKRRKFENLSHTGDRRGEDMDCCRQVRGKITGKRVTERKISLKNLRR